MFSKKRSIEREFMSREEAELKDVEEQKAPVPIAAVQNRGVKHTQDLDNSLQTNPFQVRVTPVVDPELGVCMVPQAGAVPSNEHYITDMGGAHAFTEQEVLDAMMQYNGYVPETAQYVVDEHGEKRNLDDPNNMSTTQRVAYAKGWHEDLAEQQTRLCKFGIHEIHPVACSNQLKAEAIARKENKPVPTKHHMPKLPVW